MFSSMVRIAKVAEMSRPAMRYTLLDGLRGVAALCVLIYHYGMFKDKSWLNGAWASVDVFFLLSGFVIAHAYDNRIRTGMAFGAFAVVRLIRLWPLYMVGLVMGLVAALVTTGPAADAEKLNKAVLFGIFWIPTLQTEVWPTGSHLISGPVFPLNDPAWSLFFELIANAAFFLYVRLGRSGLMLRAYLLLLPIYVGASLFVPGVFNQGHSVDGFVYGLPRVMFGFFGGVFLYSHGHHVMAWLQRLVGARPSVYGIAAAASLTLLLVVFGLGGGMTAFLNSIILAPVTVFLLSWLQPEVSNRPGRLLEAVCKWLGALSYPVYVIHMPLYRLTFFLFDLDMQHVVLVNVLTAVACVLLSWVLIDVDFSVRSRLSKRFVNVPLNR